MNVRPTKLGEQTMGSASEGQYGETDADYAERTARYQQAVQAGHQQVAGYQQTGGYEQTGAYGTGYVEEGGGAGAVAGTVLAGTLMMISGAIGFLQGLAMVIRGGFFVFHANYAYHWTVHGWGWTELIIGAVVFAAGVCVLMGMLWARVVGVILASLSAIASFLTLPYYPIWSITLIAVNAFIIWALVTSGGRRQQAGSY